MASCSRCPGHEKSLQAAAGLQGVPLHAELAPVLSHAKLATKPTCDLAAAVVAAAAVLLLLVACCCCCC